jgi:hypothetical protein
MTILTDMDMNASDDPDPNVGLKLDLERAMESPAEEEQLPWGNDPSTATWAPMMAEASNDHNFQAHSPKYQPRSSAQTGGALPP